MNILFHSNQLGLRGSEVSMYNLAYACKHILGYNCRIAARIDKTQATLEKFSREFPVLLYKDFQEVELEIQNNNIDWLYAQKGGKIDGVQSKFCKNFIHVVFQRYEPHGDRYCFISKWLASHLGHNKEEDYLPYIVSLPDTNEDLRKNFKIPEGAIVYGRHGGEEEFNLPFVHRDIRIILEKRPDIYFLFLGTNRFIDHPRAIFMEATWNQLGIRRFINTCDYMIHARYNGESFGLAMAEFLYCNKPVLTWHNGIDKNHLWMCGEKGIYYYDTDLLDKFYSLPKNLKIDVTSCVQEFTSENVVSKFHRLIS